MAIETLTARAGLDTLIAASETVPVFLFKHSIICGASFAALEEYERFVTARPPGAGERYALIEIQRAPELSAAVAEITGVRHHSPQVLLLRGGAVLWHTSHWRINEEELGAALRRLDATADS